jgi:AcrR family transcriptional regulator
MILRAVAPSAVKDEALVAQKRAAIAAACVPLFHRYGYHATTTRQIAAASGLTMGGLYLYIREKSDCLRFILDSIRADVVALGEGSGAGLGADAALRATVVDVVRGMHRHRREILVLDQARDVLLSTAGAAVFGYEQQVVSRIAAILERGVAEGRLDPGDDIAHTALSIYWQCGLWVYRYERLRQQVDVETFAQRQADLLLRGVLSR